MIHDKTTIHLYIQGACGNQFFQYAFARTLQEKLHADLVINYSRIHKSRSLWEGSDNLLKDFHTVPYSYENKLGFGGVIFRLIKYFRILFRLEFFSKRTYRFLLWCARVLPCFGIYYFDAAYYRFAVRKHRHIYISGFYESPRYFAGIDSKIREELKPRRALLAQNRELFERINNSESVCITIKRMDIENPDISDIYHYDLSYFYRGIAYIKKRLEHPAFFIFADDIQWCRENLQIDGEVHFETAGNPIWEKIRLMSSCKHFIIHNSTFSWWVQHLAENPGKIVLAPSRWMNREDQPIDIYEDNWLYITADGEITDYHE